MKTAIVDAMRIEEAGLNALQTQRQLFFDGWLIRLSPGKAKRARSVNPHFGSSLPLDVKIARGESLYAANALPALFRMIPFAHPANLRSALAGRGYIAFDPTLVQVVALDDVPNVEAGRDVDLVTPPAEHFVEAIGELRASAPTERAAHLERLACTLLQWARDRGATHAFLQVNADNAPALRVYRCFGFATTYTCGYLARPGECR